MDSTETIETPATDAAAPSLPAVMADTLGELVDGVAALDGMMAAVTAMRAELIDQARQWSEVTENASTLAGDGGWRSDRVARRVLVTELACAMRLPERTVERLVAESESLLHELPATLHALHEGEISYRHAQSVIDHAGSVPDGARAAFESEALPYAKRLTVSRFERKARSLRERAHPQSIDERHKTAVEGRSVELQPARDGMAWLSAHLPATTAHGIFNRLTDIAGDLHAPDETRTLAQKRADVFSDLLIDGTIEGATSSRGTRGEDVDAGGDTGPANEGTPGGIGRGIRARVLVTVPVLRLLGHGDEPAQLEGYGPIDMETARRLAADAPSFTRLLTHPETGAVLSVGRTRYAPPNDLRTWLRVRDESCRFPGCARGAGRCDLDHTLDWQYNGESAHDNLAHLCPYHHKLKHHTRWSVANSRDGTLTWTSPTGHRYSTEPATRMPDTG